jgi:hypothetical protein
MLKHDLSVGIGERLYIGSRIHLGDVIMSLNIMYNLSLESGVRCAVPCSPGDRVSQLMGIFDYGEALVGCSEMERRRGASRGGAAISASEAVSTASRNVGCTKSKSLGAFMCWKAEAKARKSFPYRLGSFRLPPSRVEPTGVRGARCCQMNTGSPLPGKERLSKMEVDAANAMFGGRDSVHVGGPGTDTYTGGLRTHYAPLREQSGFILGCGGFYGIDSGMSHLAGSLGLGGDVVIQDTNEDDIECITGMYRFMYPAMRTHRRSVLRGVAPGRGMSALLQ